VLRGILLLAVSIPFLFGHAHAVGEEAV
jgi:hypothetical protein